MEDEVIGYNITSLCKEYVYGVKLASPARDRR